MRNMDWFCKLRLIFITAMYVALSSGCVGGFTPQPVLIRSSPNPTTTTTNEIKATNAITITSSPPATFQSADYTTLIWEMLGKVNIDRALSDLKQLTGEEPLCIDNDCFLIKNRKTGSEGLSWAKKYVYRELVRLGYLVELQNWSSSGNVDQNIIAKKPGALHPKEEIYFVAHLDGAASGLLKRFPAADDDASGVVDILEMGRVLNGYSFKRTVVLLISTGEEQDGGGVESYLRQLSPSELSSIQFVVNIDMIGYDANQDRVMELWHGDHPPSIDFTHRISETIQAYQLDLAPRFVVGCG